MPGLNWELFEQLQGGSTDNWEGLCRSAVFRNFGSLGSLRSVAMQPGVEFHLRVNQPSKMLGDPGMWWGWQCRWYGLSAGTQIGSARRAQVEEAIRKTEEREPEITDWVLWTRRSLTPTDQKWFYAISTPLQLHLWTEDQLETLLQGDAEILKRAYFGDLVLTADKLRGIRESALAPVSDRWIPEVHIMVEIEKEIRRFLGEDQFWPEIEELANELAVTISELTGFANLGEEDLKAHLLSLIEDLNHLRTTFSELLLALTDRNLQQARELSVAEWIPRISRTAGRQLARALRRRLHQSSILVQAAISQQQESLKLLSRVSEYLSVNLIAVVGPAGCGKTHLAAALTAETGNRLSGLYMEAWPLKRRGTIDDLLPRLRGLPGASFGEVLEAVESAGVRYHARIPIVIDGLTESEDPATWKGELEAIRIMLSSFQHIVVVVTLRPSAAAVAIPDSLPCVELQGFSSLTEEAISRYFDYYKINSAGLKLPLERFSDPLFLRIFCEATNPDRSVRVGPERIPTSLVAAFGEFRHVVVNRLAGKPGISVRRYPTDILRALDKIALVMWDTGRRAMPFNEIRELIGDVSADWTESLARALEDEGVLSRDPYGDQRTVILFDAFAGFLIADALTKQKGQEDFAEWLREDLTRRRLSSPQWHVPGRTTNSRKWLSNSIADRMCSVCRSIMGVLPFSKSKAKFSELPAGRQSHPLASDVRKAFVGLVPRRFQMQFWQFVDEDLQREALVDSAELEGELLDSSTVNEIARVAVQPPNFRFSGSLRPVC